jgi:hypothetical protein
MPASQEFQPAADRTASVFSPSRRRDIRAKNSLLKYFRQIFGNWRSRGAQLKNPITAAEP